MPCQAHKTPDPSCDLCDALRHDPNTGWGGFTDHDAKQTFATEKEQREYYRQARARGETGIRETWSNDSSNR